MWELVIIWNGGDKDIEEFDRKEDAKRAQAEMWLNFCNQIEWTCVRRKIND